MAIARALDGSEAGSIRSLGVLVLGLTYLTERFAGVSVPAFVER